MNVTGPQQHGGGAGTTEHPVAVQQTTVIQMGGQKSVVGAVLLAFFVGGVVPGPYTAPAAWHDDPQGSGRLRYYDGTRWTDKYADKPGGPPPQAQIAQADTTVLETGAGACESCGGAIEGNDRFCPACGHEQAEN